MFVTSSYRFRGTLNQIYLTLPQDQDVLAASAIKTLKRYDEQDAQKHFPQGLITINWR
jgi:hypothetical protein